MLHFAPFHRIYPGLTHRSAPERAAALSRVLCEPSLAGCWVLQHPGSAGCWRVLGAAAPSSAGCWVLQHTSQLGALAPSCALCAPWSGVEPMSDPLAQCAVDLKQATYEAIRVQASHTAAEAEVMAREVEMVLAVLIPRPAADTSSLETGGSIEPAKSGDVGVRACVLVRG